MDARVVPSLEELDIAYDVVTKLIVYHSLPGECSEPQWIGLKSTQRLIERTIAQTYGQHRWIEYTERRHAVR